MTLQRTQIEVLLEDLEATALRRHRADPGDPTLSRDVVEQARALLRVATVDQHLHICDHAQHLLLRLGGDTEEEARPRHDVGHAVDWHAVDGHAVDGYAVDGYAVDGHAVDGHAVDDGILRAVQPTRDRVPDLGIPLVDDPFDLDAYVPREPAAPSLPARIPAHTRAPTPVRMLAAPRAVQVLAPQRATSATTAATTAPDSFAERRARAREADGDELRRGLTAQQLQTLDTMSHFGWTLRFVRRPLFQPPVPVAFDRNRERFVVVAPDGSIDDAPGLQVRD
jgi:hypothetical protein